MILSYQLFISGSFCAQTVLPLPPESGFPHPVHHHLEEEPLFDPRVHLDLSRPDYVVTFPHMEKVERAPCVSSNKGSLFAWSGPFQLLSEEGLRVVRNIVRREGHRSVEFLTDRIQNMIII